MLTAVKGVYKDGIATPVEKIALDGPSDVLIVFPDLPEPGMRLMRAAGSWSDVDAEDLKKRIRSDRSVSTRKAVRL